MRVKHLFRRLRWPLVATAVAVTSLSLAPNLASGQTGKSAPKPIGQAAPKPTIVLVHGAWADASSWDGVIPRLLHDGYTVDAPPNPLRGLPGDSAFLASYLKTIPGPIILVGHSYGGAVITNAATGDKKVKALVYVDAFAPKKGETLEHLAFARPGSCLAGGGNPANVFNFVVDPSLPAGDPDLFLKTAAGTDYLGFDACFANHLSASQAAVLAIGQRPLAAGAFTEHSGPAAWRTIPSWALIGTQDRVIPPAELLFMARRAHAHIEMVKAGHLSMVSQPRVTANLIVTAARATT